MHCSHRMHLQVCEALCFQGYEQSYPCVAGTKFCIEMQDNHSALELWIARIFCKDYSLQLLEMQKLFCPGSLLIKHVHLLLPVLLSVRGRCCNLTLGNSFFLRWLLLLLKVLLVFIWRTVIFGHKNTQNLHEVFWKKHSQNIVLGCFFLKAICSSMLRLLSPSLNFGRWAMVLFCVALFLLDQCCERKEFLGCYYWESWLQKKIRLTYHH